MSNALILFERQRPKRPSCEQAQLKIDIAVKIQAANEQILKIINRKDQIHNEQDLEKLEVEVLMFDSWVFEMFFFT